jgi:DNA-3-methyladenine glycosylase I
VAYHDVEWGVPVRDDGKLFEFLVLEGAQAGLSWSTILRKREGYRVAFDGFDPVKVASYDEDRISQLLADPGIVRNRQKVRSAVSNARAFLAVQQEFGTFSHYIWSFTGGTPIQNSWRTLDQIPSTSPLAEAISRDLKSRGFRFVGPTIVYAHMQATGMVNDHLVTCFRHAEVAEMG